MSTPLLPDALWNVIQPLLPPSPRRPKGGRPRLRDRACLTGILLVLRSGIPWEMLPQELGCGSGMTCCGGYATGKRRASGNDRRGK